MLIGKELEPYFGPWLDLAIFIVAIFLFYCIVILE